MTLIGVDFESFWGKKYSLTNLSYEEYIFSDKFLVQCVGIKIDKDPAYLVWGPEQNPQPYHGPHKSAFGEVEPDSQSKYDPIGVHLRKLREKYPDAAFYAHNMAFDGPILRWVYNIEPDLWVCTQRMASLIWPHESSALFAVAPRCGAGRKGKELANIKDMAIIPENQKPLIERYCLNDIDITAKCLEFMTEFIPNDEIRIMDITLRMFIERPFEVDKKALAKFGYEEAQKRELVIHKANNIDHKLARSVLASNDQFASWIIDQGIDFNKVHSPTAKNPDNMKWPLEKTCDEFLNLQIEYPQYKDVWEARLAVSSNINITRAKRMLDHSEVHKYNQDERLGFLLQTYGASNTLRWSGSNRVNGQNLPKGTPLRTALRAPEGFKIAVLDQSNIEARMLAWMAGEEDMLTAFQEGRDLYSEFATTVYNYPVSKKTPTERFVGKTCILGLGYQMGAKRLRNTLGIGMGGMSVQLTIDEARQLVMRYRNTYRAIQNLWHEAAGILQTLIHTEKGTTNIWRGLVIHRHMIELQNGTMLHYPAIHNRVDDSTGESEVVYRGRNGWVHMFPGKLVENIIQALARIVIAHNLLQADNLIGHLGSKGMVALLVHDELVTIVEDNLVEQYLLEQSKNMREPPDWCAEGGLALDVEGGYDQTYSK